MQCTPTRGSGIARQGASTERNENNRDYTKDRKEGHARPSKNKGGRETTSTGARDRSQARHRPRGEQKETGQGTRKRGKREDAEERKETTQGAQKERKTRRRTRRNQAWRGGGDNDTGEERADREPFQELTQWAQGALRSWRADMRVLGKKQIIENPAHSDDTATEIGDELQQSQEGKGSWHIYTRT